MAKPKLRWKTWPDFDEEGNTGRWCMGPGGQPVACTCGHYGKAEAELIVKAINYYLAPGDTGLALPRKKP